MESQRQDHSEVIHFLPSSNFVQAVCPYEGHTSNTTIMASAFCKHCATAIRAAARAVSSCAQERHATGLVPALRVLLSLRSNACVSVPVRSNLHGRITKAFNAVGKNVLNMAIFRKKLIFFRWLPHYPFTCSIFSHGDQWASAFCKHCATASEAAARAVSSWLENQWPPKPSRFSAKSQDSGQLRGT